MKLSQNDVQQIKITYNTLLNQSTSNKINSTINQIIQKIQFVIINHEEFAKYIVIPLGKWKRNVQFLLKKCHFNSSDAEKFNSYLFYIILISYKFTKLHQLKTQSARQQFKQLWNQLMTNLNLIYDLIKKILVNQKQGNFKHLYWRTYHGKQPINLVLKQQLLRNLAHDDSSIPAKVREIQLEQKRVLEICGLLSSFRIQITQTQLKSLLVAIRSLTHQLTNGCLAVYAPIWRKRDVLHLSDHLQRGINQFYFSKNKRDRLKLVIMIRALISYLIF